jgi:hypothetical protein
MGTWVVGAVRCTCVVLGENGGISSFGSSMDSCCHVFFAVCASRRSVMDSLKCRIVVIDGKFT